MIGIYFIYSKSQNQYYIGKSIDIQKRFWKHLSDLHLGKHHSPYLQFVFNKYGEDDLIFSIVEECSVKDNLGQLEKDYIIKYNSYETGFNCTLGGDGGTLGRKFSLETLQKMSERVSGDKNPGWQKFGDLNPNSKVSKEVASYIYFFTHSNKIFPKITRKQFLGKHNITVDIYKKIQQNRTWPNLRKEISLNDEDMYNKTLNFIETILSEAAIAERATTSENKLTCL